MPAAGVTRKILIDRRVIRKSSSAPRRRRKVIKADVAGPRASAPGQIAVAERQVPITLPGDAEDGIRNAGLHGSAAVVTHAAQPVPSLEESDVDIRRILPDARQ